MKEKLREAHRNKTKRQVKILNETDTRENIIGL